MTEQAHEIQRYGARVFKVSNSTLLIKQTVKGGGGHNDSYVIDEDKERHVDMSDDLINISAGA